MSMKSDRRTRNDGLLLALVVLLIAVVAGGAFFLWLKISAPDSLPKPEAQDQRSAAEQFLPGEPMAITFAYPSDGMLSTGTASVPRRLDTQSQAREALNALFADQRAMQAAVLKDVQLRELYIDASGNATIDLALLQQKNLRASAWEEHLALSALANTVMQNFPEVKAVRILIDGRAAQTLAGHIDLSRSFTRRTDLIRQQ